MRPAGSVVNLSSTAGDVAHSAGRHGAWGCEEPAWCYSATASMCFVAWPSPQLFYHEGSDHRLRALLIQPPDCRVTGSEAKSEKRRGSVRPGRRWGAANGAGTCKPAGDSGGHRCVGVAWTASKSQWSPRKSHPSMESPRPQKVYHCRAR